MFAILVHMPTFGLLDWTLDETQAIDSTHNFHINSDIERVYVYVKRQQGRKGLTAIETVFECRIISLQQHLLIIKYRSAESPCIRENDNIKADNRRITNCHFEVYAFAIKEQEISTKSPMHNRDRNTGSVAKCDNRCRRCGVNSEDFITHIISCYSFILSNVSGI